MTGPIDNFTSSEKFSKSPRDTKLVQDLIKAKDMFAPSEEIEVYSCHVLDLGGC